LRKTQSQAKGPGGVSPRSARVSLAAVAIASLAGFCCILYLYAPSLKGHFVFDDLSLPFCQIAIRDGSLAQWLSLQRPVLMFSYWLNYRLWGAAPFSYHFVNLAIHFTNSGLVFLILLRLVRNAGWTQRRALIGSLAGAVLFAIHPLQTESVSYVAGRSESLESFFLLLAYLVFLYRRQEAISWYEALLVVILFGVAVSTKENAVSLAGILILTDLSWPLPVSMRGLKRNWRLYCLMIPGVIAAAVAVFRLLAAAPSAGFSVVTFKWYQYAFTEARAIFSYIRLAVLPYGQSLDQDYPTSHTIFEYCAIYYMAALLALIILAVVWRRRYPLFFFGLFTFLILLAPTSSIVPIDDALVERRMYLALLGVILIGFEIASRLPISPAVGACLCAFFFLILGKFCYDRNRLWGQPDRLLELAASQTAYNPRPLLNFAELLIRHGRCDLAPAYLQRAERRLPNNYYVNASWGRALACLGRFSEAVQRLQAAARIQDSSQVYEWMGLVYGQMGLEDQAGAALKKAVELGPGSETAHGSLALWYEKLNNINAAKAEYQKAVSLDRLDPWAQAGLRRVESMESELP
jgi:Tfp pilus assembly protein PilF